MSFELCSRNKTAVINGEEDGFFELFSSFQVKSPGWSRIRAAFDQNPTIAGSEQIGDLRGELIELRTVYLKQLKQTLPTARKGAPKSREIRDRVLAELAADQWPEKFEELLRVLDDAAATDQRIDCSSD